MGAEGLTLPLARCSTQEREPCTSCGQHNQTGPKGKGMGEPAPSVQEWESWPSPSLAATLGKVGLNLDWVAQWSWFWRLGFRWAGPKGMRTRELTLPPTECVIKWPSLSSPGELILDKGETSTGTTQSQFQTSELHSPNLCHLQIVWTYKRASPVIPKLQGLHDTRQQQDNWEKSWWGSILMESQNPEI